MSDAAKEVLALEELQKRITRAPYHQWLGLNVVAFTEDSIEVRATWREEWVVNIERRYTHGGVLAALVDLGADWALAGKLGRAVEVAEVVLDERHRAAKEGEVGECVARLGQRPLKRVGHARKVADPFHRLQPVSGEERCELRALHRRTLQQLRPAHLVGGLVGELRHEIALLRCEVHRGEAVG